MEYHIEHVTEKYVEGLASAIDGVARERRYLAFLQALPLDKIRAFVRANIEHGYPQFVALHENEVVGWCDITSLNRPVFDHAGVLGMGVVAAHRGSGLGRKLLDATLERARAVGIERVEMTVRASNPQLVAWYEQAGFVREGLKHRAVKIDGQYDDLVCLAKFLKA